MWKAHVIHTLITMIQLQKYTWLIETIRRAGKISHKDLSESWENNRDLNDGKPLHRATFNRWRDAIFSQFGIIISCQKGGGYLYYIENPEDIDENQLKKWMLDSFAVGNIIGENLSQKDRIIVDEIPSGRYHLTTFLDAMKNNRVVEITYRPFNKQQDFTFPVKPYCVKLFENRWYVLALNNRDEIKIYGLDRIEIAVITDETFKMPADFSADAFFATNFGIVVGYGLKARRIVVRAHDDHRHYLKSLPLHHSQNLIEECEDYADFELYLAPTYDFIMKLLQFGAMIEVVSPLELRHTVKAWLKDALDLYKDDKEDF